MTYADFNAGDIPHRVRTLEEGHRELRTEVRAMSGTLSEIKGDVKGIAAAIGSTPSRCIEHGMKAQAAHECCQDHEERLESIERRPCANTCKNDEKVASLLEFRKVWEPRLWMGFGALVLVQILVGVAMKWLH